MLSPCQALAHASGPPTHTQVGHLITAFTAGHAIDLARLAADPAVSVLLPTRAQWDELRAAETAAAIDVAADPKAALTAILGTFLPAARKEYSERNEADKKVFADWCARLNWYMGLRRASVVPVFEQSGGGKKQKVQ